MTTAAASDGLEIWLGWNYYIQVNIFMTWSRKRQYFLKHFYGWCHLRYLRLLQFDNILRYQNASLQQTCLIHFNKQTFQEIRPASHSATFHTEPWPQQSPRSGWKHLTSLTRLERFQGSIIGFSKMKVISWKLWDLKSNSKSAEFFYVGGRSFERWGRRPFGLQTAQKVSSSPLTADSSNPTLQTCQYDPPCDSNHVKIKLISASATKKEYAHVYIPMKQL